MKIPRRKIRMLLIIILIVLLGTGIFIWLAAGSLVHPPRRALQAYHHEWLEQAAAHGITITKFSALRDEVPCLLVEADAAHGPGERGTILRKQAGSRVSTER